VFERHQDYLLTVASVPVGGVTDVPLQLDSDAPFALRLVRSRNLVTIDTPGTVLANGFRFQTPRRQYQSPQLRTDLVPDPINGRVYPTRGVVIYPQMIFPPGASIVCDIGNASGAPILNAQLLFRGSKLFADGAISAPTYPPKLAALPFTYQTAVLNVPPNGPPLIDNQLRVRNDADFAYRCGVCDPFTLVADGTPSSAAAFTSPQFKNLYVQLKDESRKAYSNAPIHVDDLFGQALPVGAPNNSNDQQVEFFPGLMTPEIYIPRDHSLYFDVYRADDPTNLVTGSAVNLYFRFIGVKVFAQ
jgi:hypothetical protein